MCVYIYINVCVRVWVCTRTSIHPPLPSYTPHLNVQQVVLHPAHPAPAPDHAPKQAVAPALQAEADLLFGGFIHGVSGM